MQVLYGTLVRVHQTAMTLAGVAAEEMAGAVIVGIAEQVGTVAAAGAGIAAAETAAVGIAEVEIVAAETVAVGNQRG